MSTIVKLSAGRNVTVVFYGWTSSRPFSTFKLQGVKWVVSHINWKVQLNQSGRPTTALLDERTSIANF